MTIPMSISRLQGVVTAISTILRAATGDCDPVNGKCRCGMGVAYRILIRILPKRHTVTVDCCDGHRVIGSLAAWIAQSQASFGRSQAMTLVAALSTAHIGVTTPCGRRLR